MTKRENCVLLTGGALALSGLFLTSLEYPLVAALLLLTGILTVTAVLGEKICVFYLLLNVIRRIFHRESLDQRTCEIQREPPSGSIDNDSSE